MCSNFIVVVVVLCCCVFTRVFIQDFDFDTAYSSIHVLGFLFSFSCDVSLLSYYCLSLITYHFCYLSLPMWFVVLCVVVVPVPCRSVEVIKTFKLKKS
jgi:hypothetical protein